MQAVPINWWAVLVATIVKFVLGGIWFSPPVFAKQWQALTKVSQADMRAGFAKAAVVDLITTFIMAWVLAHAVRYAMGSGAMAGMPAWGQGATAGFFNWLGFIGAVQLGVTVYENRPLKLWLIGNTYQLISLVVMGAILAVWQ